MPPDAPTHTWTRDVISSHHLDAPVAVRHDVTVVRSLRLHEELQRLSSEVVVISDVDGALVYASPAVTSLFGYAPADVVACDLWGFVHPDDQDAAFKDFHRVVATGTSRTSRVRVRAADGTWRWVEQTSVNLLDATVGGIVTTLRDVTEQVTADLALRASEARFRAIADTAEEGIWAIGTSGSTLYANARMAALLGLAGGTPCDLAALAGIDPQAAAQVDSRRTRSEHRPPQRFEITYRHPDGALRSLRLSTSTLRAEDVGILGTLVMVSDITDVRLAEQELSAAALHDGLTQLPNRTLLVDRLEQALTKPGGSTAVLFVGLDGFRLVNDTHGHDVGDQLLTSIAGRLVEAVRPYDTVARLGGDEFVVLCEDTDALRARKVACSLQTALAAPHDIGGKRVAAGASIGVTVAAGGPGTSVGTAEVLRQADAAMRVAKSDDRGRVRLFDEVLGGQVEDRYALASDLRTALTDDELRLVYQPVVDVRTQRVIGMEALARWDHVVRGSVPPSTFVEVAESTGLAPLLDRWVLRRALRDAAQLHADGAVPAHAFVAVNLSARTLSEDRLDVDLAAWTAEAGLTPRHVVLEITETAIMKDTDAAVALLERLRGKGFRIALDDFGTGYSSLAYLRSLPVSTLKIDRSFLVDIATDKGALAIVNAVVDLARAVGVHVVAEGVETAAQSGLLRQLGCDSAQGWLWGPGLSPEEIAGRGWCDAVEADSASTLLSVGRVAPSLPVLEQLLELHRQGASPSTVAAALNAQGLRTAAGARWHRSSVRRAIAEAAPPAPAQPGPR